MQSSYNAVLKREGKEWTGWIEEMPEVNGCAPTQEALYALLREQLTNTLANHQAAQQNADDRLTDSLATDYIITRDFLL